MAHASEEKMIKKTRNTARFFTEQRHIAWILLIGTILWGVFGYLQMPKRKDPEIPVRVAAAIASWPGATAESVEERVTRVIEAELAENSKIERIESTTRTGVAVVTITLDPSVKDTAKEFDDIWLKLGSLRGLPDGASVEFQKDFGDVSALMLSVSSPKASDVEIDLLAKQLAEAIRRVRAAAPPAKPGERAAVVACFPNSLDTSDLGNLVADLARWTETKGARELRMLSGPGFLGFDVRSGESDQDLRKGAERFLAERLRAADLHPDTWPLVVIRDPARARAELRARAGDKYSYRELDEYTDQMQKALQALPEVAKVTRSGELSDVIYLDYSQEKLAAYGVLPGQIQNILGAHNVVARGGAMDVDGKQVLIAPAGEFKNEAEIGDVIVTRASDGAPVYLRDLVTISRSYQSPQFLSFASYKDAQGEWQRSRSIALSLSMKSGLQVADFGKSVQTELARVQSLLP